MSKFSQTRNIFLIQFYNPPAFEFNIHNIYNKILEAKLILEAKKRRKKIFFLNIPYSSFKKNNSNDEIRINIKIFCFNFLILLKIFLKRFYFFKKFFFFNRLFPLVIISCPLFVLFHNIHVFFISIPFIIIIMM